MKAWIMLIDPLKISVFHANSSKNDVTLYTVIQNGDGDMSEFPKRGQGQGQGQGQQQQIKQISDDFAHYVAEEIEIACGCGTNTGLIFSGETSDVQKVCRSLSPAVKGSIIGITPKGYIPFLWRQILGVSG